MTDKEFKGRLRELMALHRRQMWLKVADCTLGVLTAAAVLAILFVLFCS